ncbi:MAG: hypothetical protein H0W23_10030, partial [Chloroflexia bacterium]|nr:hypothetical protein [Chloroflexia bacterium]
MNGLDLALVNAALANDTRGAGASRIEIEHISGNGRAVSGIALGADPASGVRLPPTMIAKWTTEPA